MVREWLRSQRASLQWYIVPRAACHICEPKWPVSWYLAQEDYYGRSGAHLQLYCDVAGEALGLAIIRPTGRATKEGPGEAGGKTSVRAICSAGFQNSLKSLLCSCVSTTLPTSS